jgi:hypothetical protein
LTGPTGYKKIRAFPNIKRRGKKKMMTRTRTRTKKKMTRTNQKILKRKEMRWFWFLIEMTGSWKGLLSSSSLSVKR